MRSLIPYVYIHCLFPSSFEPFRAALVWPRNQFHRTDKHPKPVRHTDQTQIICIAKNFGKSEQIRKDNGIPLDKTRFPRARRLAKADGPCRPAGNAL
jgi:hypothetical protein